MAPDHEVAVEQEVGQVMLELGWEGPNAAIVRLEPGVGPGGPIFDQLRYYLEALKAHEE
jgi:hypothetical protein